MKRFVIGEKVKCIDRYGFQNIKIGNIYTVEGYRENGLVILEEFPKCAYEQTFFEPVEKEKFNKKEGNKVIESINLIDLYASKHRESIEKETKEKVEELRRKCDVINKYNELVEQFEIYLNLQRKKKTKCY